MGKPGETMVDFKEDYYLGMYEVTQDEWEKVMGLTPSDFKRGNPAVQNISDADLKRFPVENVSWDDFQEFIKKLNEREQESGWVYRLPSADEWEYGWVGIDPLKHDGALINEVNDLAVYNGNLYAGVIPKAEVWRYAGDRKWKLLKQLVHNDRWAVKDITTWNRVPSFAVFQGKLFAGNSTCHGRADENGLPIVGRVYSFEAGRNVAYDKDLGTDWTHIAATRAGTVLNLYINGQLVSNSTPTNDVWDLTNSAPLRIGFGQSNYFTGSLCEVRLYNRALTGTEVSHIKGWQK